MGKGGRKLDPADHLRRPWRVHALAAAEGLSLHDVWEVGTPLAPGVSLAVWVEALRSERRSSLSQLLFGVRQLLGQVFQLDRESRGFEPVYREADEELSRIENHTVTAFLHFSLADRHPRLAVYVKPKGALGRGYMYLIEPFRRWVVYPALLDAGSRAASKLGL